MRRCFFNIIEHCFFLVCILYKYFYLRYYEIMIKNRFVHLTYVYIRFKINLLIALELLCTYVYIICIKTGAIYAKILGGSIVSMEIGHTSSREC